ncbi:MAG: hypothetical protein KatS3mg132_932 [Limisphaera sp.]|nr:MAG: hypothetical protein KatS3mg132_932 [Limisphaera sp.]
MAHADETALGPGPSPEEKIGVREDKLAKRAPRKGWPVPFPKQAGRTGTLLERSFIRMAKQRQKPRESKQETTPKRVLRFGLPKGSLQEATLEKLAKAGYHVQVSSRSYIPYVDDEELEVRLIRAQEISRYVEHGYLDCGITGYDWIVENGSKVHEVGEFLFSKATRRPARWVLCVPEDSPIRSVKDLQGKRIATEVVNITRRLPAQARGEGRGGVLLGRHRGQGP